MRHAHEASMRKGSLAVLNSTEVRDVACGQDVAIMPSKRVK